jgi:hypothetical protein
VQDCIKRKSLLSAAVGLGPDKLEVAIFSAAEQPTDFAQVLAKVGVEARKNLGIAGVRIGRNLGKDNGANRAARLGHAGV